MIEALLNKTVIVKVISKYRFCRDQKDDKFVNLAVENEAFIITRDNHLLELAPILNIPVLPPSDFLNFY